MSNTNLLESEGNLADAFVCRVCYLFSFFFPQGVFSEIVSISNLGIAETGPMVEESGSLLIEYVNGSACTTSEGRQTTYTTRIHLVCSRGSLVRRRWARSGGCGQHRATCGSSETSGSGLGGGVRVLRVLLPVSP